MKSLILLAAFVVYGMSTFAQDFDKIYVEYDGLRLVKKDSKFGYIDANDKLVIPLIYDGGAEFNNGKAFVKKDGLIGGINKANKVILPFQFDGYKSQNTKGYKIIEKGGKYGVINTDFTIVLEPRYKKIYKDGEGVSIVVNDENKAGFYLLGEGFITDFKYSTAGMSAFENGKAGCVIDGKPGYIDINGKEHFDLEGDIEVSYSFAMEYLSGKEDRKFLCWNKKTGKNHVYSLKKGGAIGYLREGIPTGDIKEVIGTGGEIRMKMISHYFHDKDVDAVSTYAKFKVLVWNSKSGKAAYFAFNGKTKSFDKLVCLDRLDVSSLNNGSGRIMYDIVVDQRKFRDPYFVLLAWNTRTGKSITARMKDRFTSYFTVIEDNGTIPMKELTDYGYSFDKDGEILMSLDIEKVLNSYQAINCMVWTEKTGIFGIYRRANDGNVSNSGKFAFRDEFNTLGGDYLRTSGNGKYRMEFFESYSEKRHKKEFFMYNQASSKYEIGQVKRNQEKRQFEIQAYPANVAFPKGYYSNISDGSGEIGMDYEVGQNFRRMDYSCVIWSKLTGKIEFAYFDFDKKKFVIDYTGKIDL